MQSVITNMTSVIYIQMMEEYRMEFQLHTVSTFLTEIWRTILFEQLAKMNM